MADGPFPALVAAVQQFRNDQYSQTRRWQKGYSDCSSFVGKGMKALNRDMGGSTTLTYLASSKWHTIPKAQAGPGDIAVNAAHMVLVTGPNAAIGQQNPRSDVNTGSISSLMSGTGPYVIKRYSGGSNVTFAGFTDGAQAAFELPGALTDTAKWLSDTTNWYRVGMVFAGVVLLIIAIVGIGKSTTTGGVLGTSIQAKGKKVLKGGKSKS